MGAGLAQIGILIALTVIGLPLFFFGLMAALDRFEKSLSDSPRSATTVAPAEPANSAVSAAAPAAVKPDADVLTLPAAPAATLPESAAAI